MRYLEVYMANVQSLPILLKELRLTAIAKDWQVVAQKAVSEQWEPELFLAELCELEANPGPGSDDRRSLHARGRSGGASGTPGHRTGSRLPPACRTTAVLGRPRTG